VSAALADDADASVGNNCISNNNNIITMVIIAPIIITIITRIRIMIGFTIHECSQM
jgi:hypothetical protein